MENLSTKETAAFNYLNAFNNCLVKGKHVDQAGRSIFTISCSSMVWKTLKAEGRFHVVPAVKPCECFVFVC